MYQSIGEIKTAHADDNSFCFCCEKADVLLEVINTHIIKVHVARTGEHWQNHSYAVCHEPKKPVNVQFESHDNNYEINNGYLQIIVQKKPFALSYFNNGSLLNADDPSLSIQFDGDETVNYKQLQADEKFVGLGEKTFGLNKRGTQLVNWNTDQFGYHGESDPLYGSYPFYYGITGGKVYGIFLDNSSKTVFNFGASNHRFSFFSTAKAQLRYYFIHDETPEKILGHYTQLTGRANMPPLWALGYQQCRYSYYPDYEFRLLAENFIARKIPCDVLYYDIHYMESYKVFTWDKTRFPNPAQLNTDLQNKGFRTVAIIDPGVKVEDNYEVYESGKKEDVFIKFSDGQLYSGDAWPGTCHFPDFTNEKTRKWWATYISKLQKDGISGIWNDMNEPAVWGKNFPDITQFSCDENETDHKEAHNVYGMQMARSSYEALNTANERPFVLTRSGFAGVQRYSAVWTGDNNSDENHITLGQLIVNNLGLAGVAFCGNDIGGFIGEAYPDLFARWIALGAFSPFFRGHTMVNSRDAEPWSFGEECEDVSRNYIHLRYKLLSYLYSCFYQHTISGLPICQSLFLKHYENEKTYQTAFQAQFYFGDAFLIAPITAHRGLHKIWLPPTQHSGFYDFYNDEFLGKDKEYIGEYGINKIPVFIKSGAIVPVLESAQNTASINWSRVELHIYKGEGKFEWYLDDGISKAHEQGAFCLKKITLNCDEPNKWQLTMGKSEGSYQAEIKEIALYLHGFENDELPENYEQVDYRWVGKVSNFDPYFSGGDDGLTILQLPTRSISWQDEAQIIKL